MAAAAGTLTFGRFLGRSLGAARGLSAAVRCFGVKTSPSGEKITHTGQVYDEEDYRRIRFVGRQKEVPARLITEPLYVPQNQFEQMGKVFIPFDLGSSPSSAANVNENFAVDLIAEQSVAKVESRVISCDGGGGALGHPKVYINLDKETKTGTCGYCGLQFKQHHHHH